MNKSTKWRVKALSHKNVKKKETNFLLHPYIYPFDLPSQKVCSLFSVSTYFMCAVNTRTGKKKEFNSPGHKNAWWFWGVRVGRRKEEKKRNRLTNFLLASSQLQKRFYILSFIFFFLFSLSVSISHFSSNFFLCIFTYWLDFSIQFVIIKSRVFFPPR